MTGKKKMFVLILVALLTASPGCYRAEKGSDIEDTEADVDTTFDEDTAADTDFALDSDTETLECDGFGIKTQYEVRSPEPGIAPEPEEICQETTPVVESNLAARVTLENGSYDLLQAEGNVEISADLIEQIIGDPQIEVLDGFPAVLEKMEVVNLKPTASGYVFDAVFPQDAWFDDRDSELIIRVTFTLSCDDQTGSTREVTATTYLHLCEGPSYPVWVSSGGDCTVCEQAFEPIAVPLPAVHHQDTFPLAPAPGITILPRQISADQVALEVESRDDLTGLDFEWHTSHGTIQPNSGTAAVWSLPTEAGPHLVQVVAKDGRRASIATLRFSRKG